jgi:hypothetical protein
MQTVWKYIRWFVYAYAAWLAILTAVRALSTPWTWTLDQILVLVWAAIIPLGIVTWGNVWRTGGWSAAKDRWKLLQTRSQEMRSGFKFMSIAFWIIVALLLVAFFNWQQQHGTR